MFLANYGDGLSDVALPRHDRFFFAKPRQSASLLLVQTYRQFFDIVNVSPEGMVTDVSRVDEQPTSGSNGGFFVMRNEIFRYISVPGRRTGARSRFHHRLIKEACSPDLQVHGFLAVAWTRSRTSSAWRS